MMKEQIRFEQIILDDISFYKSFFHTIKFCEINFDEADFLIN